MKFQKLFTEIIGCYPREKLGLNQPISDLEKESFHSTFSHPVDELTQLYQLHNGQRNGSLPVFGYRIMLNTASVLMTSQASIKRMKKNNGSPNLIELPNREKHDLRIGGTCGWERGWIPFAHNFGTYFVVDFEPAATGKAGQIVAWDSEDAIGRVIASDLNHFLEITLDKIRSGKLSDAGFQFTYTTLAQ